MRCFYVRHRGECIDYGYNITEDNELQLGYFDPLNLKGTFVDTTRDQFVFDMMIASLIKGHYMGNKGYTLDFIPAY